MSITQLNPVYPSKSANSLQWGQLHGSAQELLIANASREFQGLIVLVTPDTHSAYLAQAHIRFFSGIKDVQIFPDWETLPYEVF
jgi:transcription-repair coupling factor (superfamily II helicase)